jgi:ATP:ADP antiporter, AAA family
MFTSTLRSAAHQASPEQTRARGLRDSACSGGASGVCLFSLLAALVLAQQVGSKVLRDALFLSQASAAQLPRAFLIAAVLSAPLVLGAAWLSTRIGPRRVAAACLGLNALLFALEYALLPRAPRATAWLVYLHVVALGGTTLSSFFANVSEYYDPHSARQASVRVTAGAALGGALGGLGVSVVAERLGYAALLPCLAALNLIGAVVLSIGRFWPQLHTTREAAQPGLAWSSLGRSRYVRSIAYLPLLTSFSAILLDFDFKRQAAQSLGSGVELLPLLTAFHTATSLVTTLVQLTLARVALERLGLAGTLATLPLGLLLGGALGPLMPRLWSATGLRALSNVLESSLFRSAYEPLYTPLTQRTRRSLKTLIDVAANRVGEALGSLALLGIAAAWPGAGGLPVRSLALAGAGASLLLSLHMHSRYVAELASSLRKGCVRLKPDDARDSTTRLTLSQTHIEMERAQLLAEITAQRAALPPTAAASPRDVHAGANQPLRAEAAAAPGGRWSLAQAGSTADERVGQAGVQLKAALEDLLSAESARVTALFATGPLDVRLASFAIPLLEHKALVGPVTAALSGIAARIPGQLADALHDTTLAPAVRRRLPRILQASGQPLAAQALAGALSAPERILRYRAAGALVALSAARPALAPEPATVFERVHSELREVSDQLSMQHIFVLLSLALEREPLWLAYDALGSGDARQRGTALEYLHSTLPEPLRSELVTWAETRPSARSLAPSPLGPAYA